MTVWIKKKRSVFWTELGQHRDHLAWLTIGRSDGGGSNYSRDNSSAKDGREGDLAVLIGSLQLQERVEGKEHDGEGHISMENDQRKAGEHLIAPLISRSHCCSLLPIERGDITS